MRLTRKTNPKAEELTGFSFPKYDYNRGSNGFSVSTTQEIIDKLGELEDIEDELGIDSITLINAMRNGVYVINNDNEIIFVEPMICFNQEEMTNLYVLDGIPYYPPDKISKSCNYYLKDYGKTWALTKEELEK